MTDLSSLNLLQLKKARTPIRSLVTRTVGDTNKKLDEMETLDIANLHGYQKKLLRLTEELAAIDNQVKETLLKDDEITDEQYTEEIDSIDHYCTILETVVARIEEAIQKLNDIEKSSLTSYVSASGKDIPVSTKLRVKLPKLEIRKFSGEALDWLSWWAHFEKIHLRTDIEKADKFDYLLSALIPKTRAYDIVTSYPMTENNYPKAVEALRSRYGKPKVLRQLYVRELLKLVINNAKPSNKCELVKLYDSLESHLRALESLSVTPEQISEFVFPMVESSLPEDTLVAWQRSAYYTMDKSISDSSTTKEPVKTELHFLMEFLANEAECEIQRKIVRAGFESQAESKSNSKQNKLTVRNESVPATATNLFAKQTKLCIFCNLPHNTADCRKAEKMPHDEKIQKLSKTKTCFKCLIPNHRVKDCRNTVECSACHEKTHLKPMCQKKIEKWSADKSQKDDAEKLVAALQTNNCIQGKGEIFLKTLLVRASGSKGSKIVRLMFDEGSQRSSITIDLIKKISPPYLSADWQRNVLFGNVLTEPRKVKSYEVEIASLDNSYKMKLIFKETPSICGAIPRVKPGEWLQKLEQEGIHLADISDDRMETASVDLLIGSDYWASVISSAPKLLNNGLAVVNTKLGWTISGQMNEDVCSALNMNIALYSQHQICKLWELDAIGIKPDAVDNVDELVQQHFEETVQRTPNGRYIVNLPWKEAPSVLPTNYVVAEKRLISTTRKLVTHNLYATYDQLFNQWKDDNIIEEVQSKRICGHYLPHRAVCRPCSKTTPVRPVFDASCKIGKNKSLNECLYKGPNLLELLPSVILKFRENAVGFTADIRRAFLNIWVAVQDRDYLRFLWRHNPDELQNCVFRHLSLVFGLRCSPYLLNAVIQHHLANWVEDEPVVQKLKSSFYCDNLVGSLSLSECFETFQKRAQEIMNDAHMELREWVSSTQPSEDPTNLLGITWNSVSDTLGITPQLFPDAMPKLTRRTLSSSLQKIFDPIGLIAPVLMLPKIWLQQSWRLTKNWDEELPIEIQRAYNQWISELPGVWELQLNRHLYFDQGPVELHVFCDASKDGYATVIFACAAANPNQIMFVQARTRLAPMKPLSIPRLELMACLIGARLLHSTIIGLTVKIEHSVLWTDSSTALAWIHRGNDWSVFVRNRITEICELTLPTQWRHVPGKINPADEASRGQQPASFVQQRWWERPQWILDKNSWPKIDYAVDEELVMIETKKSTTLLFRKLEELDTWYLPTSSFSANVRIIAYVRRCIKQRDARPSTRKISQEEYQAAEKWILSKVQHDCFDDTSLMPVKHQQHDGLLCVKTKLVASKFSTQFKLPIILPSSHPAVDQIVRMEHLQGYHCGPGILLARLRSRFFIIHARKAVKRVLKDCVICKRFTAKQLTAPEGAPPTPRVTLSRTFETTGIDLAGPLHCKDGTKCWFVLFTCATYRAIHLEIVTKISANDFLLALRRFICRRGRPSLIYTDNGRNFEGAFNYLSLIDWEEVLHVYANEPIKWNFNPPIAPWWGGFWERLIRIVKDLLKRMLGKRKLMLTQIEDMLFEVEAIVNSRPLTYISSDESDLQPLTPAHFLCDISDNSLPELESLSAQGLRKKFKLLSQLRVELKKRFQKEYLGLLIHRQSSTQPSREPQLGEVVLLQSDNARRQVWNMGRIIQILPGRDGITRLVKVKTQTGEFLRPIQRVHSLEVRDTELAEIQSVVSPSTLTMQKSVPENTVRSRFGRRLKRPARYD